MSIPGLVETMLNTNWYDRSVFTTPCTGGDFVTSIAQCARSCRNIFFVLVPELFGQEDFQRLSNHLPSAVPKDMFSTLIEMGNALPLINRNNGIASDSYSAAEQLRSAP